MIWENMLNMNAPRGPIVFKGGVRWHKENPDALKCEYDLDTENPRTEPDD